MPFLSFSNANIKFAELRKLTWRLYTLAEALPTTSRITLIGKKEFVKVTFNEKVETFVIYVSGLEATIIYLF